MGAERLVLDTETKEKHHQCELHYRKVHNIPDNVPLSQKLILNAVYDHFLR